MKKIIKRVITSIALLTLVFISGLVTLLFFPQSLFANKVEYKKFSVYSDTKISKNDLRIALDDAYQLVSQSELHNPEFQFKVFMSYGNIFNAIEDLQGKGPTARATAGNIIIKVPIDFKKNEAYSSRSIVDFTEVLAHEMIHNLQADKYGMINFSPVKHPVMWKLEGYPEYVCHQKMLKVKNYSLTAEINRFITLEKAAKDRFVEVTPKHFMPKIYYKGRLMVEYLIDVKGFTYNQILEDKRSEKEVYDEMLKWTKLKM